MHTERIESLKSKHANLEQKIHKEETRPSPDEALLNALKKQKLAIKDEMNALMADA